jgi:hypothetical protein
LIKHLDGVNLAVGCGCQDCRESGSPQRVKVSPNGLYTPLKEFPMIRYLTFLMLSSLHQKGKYMKLIKAKLFIVTSAMCAVSMTSAATTIDFDNTGAPGFFNSTMPLAIKNYYENLGVTFSGSVNSFGGSILNQSGNFGFNALSGTDFLAFNTALTGDTEVLNFTNAVSSASIWAASGNPGSAFMKAYSSDGTLLSTASINSSRTWTELSVSSSSNQLISQIVLQNNSNAFAYDNLQYNVAAVPEPETFAMLLAGLAIMGFVVRRSRNNNT